MYSFPSISVNFAPLALLTQIGNAPDHLLIHGIGTPETSDLLADTATR